jgi:hypothetical protein
MTITYDNTSKTNVNTAANNVTFSHTVGADGFNGALYATVGIRTTTATVNSITYGGQNLTFYRRDTFSTTNMVETWYLTNPPTGTNNVVVNLAAASIFAVGVVSFYGVASTNPASNVSGVNASTFTTRTINLTEDHEGSWLYDALALRTNNATITVGATQVQRFAASGVGANANSSVVVAVSTKSLYGSGIGVYPMTETSSTSVNSTYHGFVISPAGNNIATSMF